MPKKTPKNAFFYFMIDFREEEKKKGKIFENMNEVQRAADPAWRVSSMPNLNLSTILMPKHLFPQSTEMINRVQP